MSSLLGILRDKVSQLSLLDNGSSSQNSNNNDLIYSRKRTRDELFTEQYKLPGSESVMCETSAEVSLSPSGSGPSSRGNISYEGKLLLSESFLIFSSLEPDDRQFNFTLPLVTFKKVTRLPSKSHIFALSVRLYHGMNIVIRVVGLSPQREYFCQVLKENLTRNLGLADQLKSFLKTFYSEFLLETLESADPTSPNPRHPAPSRPQGGLGQTFRYPGSEGKLHDKAKMRLWLEYLRECGRNVTLIRQPRFYKLIRAGLPNRLRGEIWEACCGSIFLRMENPTQYESLWEEFQGRESQATEEIEKDLNRSLPGYSAYQDPEGIARLRRVLTVYSWKNPDVGYCQAMNIVVAAFLIYMSEEQTYWCLNVLCDKLLPGYYSKTMYGTLLDQKVLEALVAKTMPILWEHMTKCDMQLSIVSLPWFLSLFINSMPLVFAFRIVDMFFLEGSKTLFQVSLAILRINGEEILDAEDDGQLIAIIKQYFSTLDQPAHPNSKNETLRRVTRFQELMVTAFKEFSIVTDDMIRDMRSKNESQVLRDIELFAKRTQLRNIPKPSNLTMDEMSIIYDRFYSVLQDTRLGFGSAKSQMGIDMFVVFLGGLIDWMDPRRLNNASLNNSKDPIPGSSESVKDSESKKYNDFVYRLFKRWDSELMGSLSLGDIIHGLDRLVDPDLMTQIAYLFELYDDEGTEEVDRDGVLKISEGLLFLTRPWREEPVLIDVLSRNVIEANKREVAEAKADLAEQEANNKHSKSKKDKDKVKANDCEKAVEDDNSNSDARSIKSAKSSRSAKSGKSIRLGSGSAHESLPSIIPLEKVKREQSIRYLSAVSNFLQRSFEYAISKESSPLVEIGDKDTIEKARHNAALNPDAPLFMNLATFRMVLLADETLEMFFSETLRESVHLTTTGTGLDQSLSKPRRNITLRGVFDGLVNDSIRVAGEVRKRIDEIDSRMEEDEEEEEDVSAVKQTDRDLLEDS